MTREEQSNYVPGNYPQGAHIDWGSVIDSIVHYRAIRRFIMSDFGSEKPSLPFERISQEKSEPLPVYNNDIEPSKASELSLEETIRRRIQTQPGWKLYGGPVAKDTVEPKDRVNDPNWKKVFQYHP